MTLTLFYHPLASYCWKVLVALYETGTPFVAKLVDLGNPAERAALTALWPIGKFPVLQDPARDRTVAESTTIIEYLAQYYPGAMTLIPAELDAAREVRHRDRLFDLYVHNNMQKIVGDRLRPADQHDPTGVADARAQLELAYGMVDRLVDRAGLGDGFTLADCAACPALFYANKVAPIGQAHAATRAYLEQLVARPSFARVLAEAEPYFRMFPG